jgi:hypothetical protein
MPGDLVIYRAGDGTATLANTGNSVFLVRGLTAEVLPGGAVELFATAVPEPASMSLLALVCASLTARRRRVCAGRSRFCSRALCRRDEYPMPGPFR